MLQQSPGRLADRVREDWGITPTAWNKLVKLGIARVFAVPGTNLKIMTREDERTFATKLVALAQSDEARVHQQHRQTVNTKASVVASKRRAGMVR